MIEFFRKLLWDQSAFERWTRMVIFVLGELVRNGVIPTGVDGLGPKLGLIISAMALLVAAGEKNPK